MTRQLQEFAYPEGIHTILVRDEQSVALSVMASQAKETAFHGILPPIVSRGILYLSGPTEVVPGDLARRYKVNECSVMLSPQDVEGLNVIAIRGQNVRLGLAGLNLARLVCIREAVGPSSKHVPQKIAIENCTVGSLNAHIVGGTIAANGLTVTDSMTLLGHGANVSLGNAATPPPELVIYATPLGCTGSCTDILTATSDLFAERTN